MSSRWIRLDDRWLEHPGLLDPVSLRAFARAVLLAADTQGVLTPAQADPRYLAAQSGCSPARARAAIETWIATDLAVLDEGSGCLELRAAQEWTAYGPPSADSTARVRALRERRRNGSETVTGPFQGGGVKRAGNGDVTPQRERNGNGYATALSHDVRESNGRARGAAPSTATRTSTATTRTRTQTGDLPLSLSLPEGTIDLWRDDWQRLLVPEGAAQWLEPTSDARRRLAEAFASDWGVESWPRLLVVLASCPWWMGRVETAEGQSPHVDPDQAFRFARKLLEGGYPVDEARLAAFSKAWLLEGEDHGA